MIGPAFLSQTSPEMFLWLDASQWVAVGTISLAIVTAWYVWLTNKVAMSSKDAAKAAERSARAAEAAARTADRSLLLQAMPILIGDKARMDGGHAKIDVSGRGIGFEVVATIRQSGSEGRSGNVAVVDALSTGTLDILPAFIVDQAQPHEVAIEYRDQLGNRYQTVRKSLLGRESSVQVMRWDDESTSWQGLV